MGAAYFYHLTAAPLEQTLPMLIGKAQGAGWRVVVRGRDAARIVWLDEKLWAGDPTSFLPHGIAGGDHDADQPVLLRSDTQTVIDGCLMAVDGAEVTAGEVAACERVCILFDGLDGNALARAREQWKALTDAGAPAQYWSQEGGRWEMKAEKA